MNDSREQILTVAYTLFLQKGYKEVSIQEITKSVGMTKGAFYYFFKNKEELYLKVFNHFMEKFFKTDYSQLSHNSLSEFYHDYLKYIVERRPVYIDGASGVSVNVYAYIFDAMKHFPDLQTGASESSISELKTWEEIVEIARRNGEIKSAMTNEQIASVFIFSGDGLGMRGIMESKWQDVPKKLLALWDAFYEGLKA